MGRANKKGHINAKRLHGPRLALFLAGMVVFGLAAVWMSASSDVRANLSDNLVGYWRFDEGTGTTAADQSSAGNDGTLVQNSGTGSPTWVSPGRNNIGSALAFDGSGALGAAENTVNVGNDASLDAMGSYMMSAWVKFEPGYVGTCAGGTEFSNIIGRNSSDPDWSYMLYINGNNGTLRAHHKQSDGTPLSVDSAATVPTGEWVHVAQVADGNQVRMFINGVEDTNSVAYDGTMQSLPGANTYIGQDARGCAINGQIDDASIHNTFAAPGGVYGGLEYWLRTDDMELTGGIATNWDDVYGWHTNEVFTGGANITLGDGFNFHNTARFNAGYLSFTSEQLLYGAAAGEVFSMVQTLREPDVSSGFPYEFGGGGSPAGWAYQYPPGGGFTDPRLITGTGATTRKIWAPLDPATGPPRDVRDPLIFNELSKANEYTARFNGLTNYTDATNTVNFNSSNGSHTYIGASHNSRFGDANLSEVIAYRKDLTQSEREQVQSYMAIQYGMTLGTTTTPLDYKASDGSTLWTGSATYQNDIAGIGRDDTSLLSQKQSKSENPGAFVTIGNGTIAADNESNPNSFDNDLTFFMWGDNAESTDVANEFEWVTNTQLKRMERIWSVQNVGDALGTLKMQIPQAELVGTSPKVLISNDETFDSTDQQIDLTTSGDDYEADITLSDGQFFTFAVDTVAPGGVPGGLTAWQKADDGTATSALWEDSGGNNNDASQGTAASQPTFNSNAINFNPAFDFGTHDDTLFMVYPNTLGITGTSNFSSFFMLSPTDFGAVWGGTGTAGEHFAFIGAPGEALTFVGGSSTVCTGGSEVVPFGVPRTASVIRDGTTIAVGQNGTTPGTGACPNSFGGTQRMLGARAGGPADQRYSGLIGEVIQYNRNVTANEKNLIESYLATKYGTTLGTTAAPVDYKASDETVFWTGSATYQNDIAGIGRDDFSSLNQKQSRSVNDDGFVAIGHGDIATTNQDNTNDFASDLTFLTWGNDNGSTDVVNDIVPVGGTQLKRMERIWKAQETGTVGSTKLQIPQAELVGDSPTLFVSNDATFDNTDQQIALTTNGGNYEADVNLADGQFFTFAVEMVDPGVTTNQADNITRDSATLHGTLDLGDFTTADVFFRYRVQGSGDTFTETAPQTLNASGDFSAPISGLSTDTQYEFKMVVQWQSAGSQESEGNLLSFVTDPAIPPDAPINLQAVSAGTSQINLSWDAPVDEGGSPITGYQIERSPDGVGGWTTIVPDTGSTDTTYPDTGLDSNTQYFYRVSAINSAGTGSPSNVADATTNMLAPQITTDLASDVTQTSATLNGTLDPFGDFTPVDVFFRYRVQGSSDPFTETTPQQMTAPGPFSVNLTGLDPDTTYEFKTVVEWEDSGTQQQEGSLATFTTLSAGGAPECDKNNVDCFVNPVTGTNVKLVVDDACTINTAKMRPETDLDVADPDGFEYPLGLMDFNVDCGTPGYTTTVTQYYYDVTNDNYILRKHNPNTDTYFTVAGATIEQTTQDSQTVTIATFQVTDGGELDIDGEANGTIIDPTGLAKSDSDLANTGQSPLPWIIAALTAIAAIVGLSLRRSRA